MKTKIEFKKFGTDKSVDELHYNSEIWLQNLAFFNIELDFLNELIKSYPFGNNIPNLFERIQLFLKEINTLKNEKYPLLNDAIHKHKKQLERKFECTDLSCDDFYIVEHEKIVQQVFNYVQDYRSFKRGLYEYMSGKLK